MRSLYFPLESQACAGLNTSVDSRNYHPAQAARGRQHREAQTQGPSPRIRFPSPALFPAVLCPSGSWSVSPVTPPPFCYVCSTNERHTGGPATSRRRRGPSRSSRQDVPSPTQAIMQEVCQRPHVTAGGTRCCTGSGTLSSQGSASPMTHSRCSSCMSPSMVPGPLEGNSTNVLQFLWAISSENAFPLPSAEEKGQMQAVSTIGLPSGSDTVNPGMLCSVAGWGLLSCEWLHRKQTARGRA